MLPMWLMSFDRKHELVGVQAKTSSKIIFKSFGRVKTGYPTSTWSGAVGFGPNIMNESLSPDCL